MPEDASLTLLTPVPEEKLQAWLKEFYGKKVEIEERELLRHRDLSYVERLKIRDALPASLIYKQVLPPWDIEQDLHERILIPSITNSAQLYMAAHYGEVTAMFMEDLGNVQVKDLATKEIAQRLGEDLAKMHRSYCYRTDELVQMGILSTLLPIDYVEFSVKLTRKLSGWKLVSRNQAKSLKTLAATLAPKLAGEPFSLVHGDLYAENIIKRDQRLFFIDWSWFTMLGVPLMDLATVTMVHQKNGALSRYREDIIDAYCFEAGRDAQDVRRVLPHAETLSRLLFLNWLVERRSRCITGTTVGPVDKLIATIVDELIERLAAIPA
jgi:thiamine kinase-like enzyme